jgi:hypothetical protein
MPKAALRAALGKGWTRHGTDETDETNEYTGRKNAVSCFLVPLFLGLILPSVSSVPCVPCPTHP